MKPSECSKYVYKRERDGFFYREGVSLHSEFAAINTAFTMFTTQKIYFIWKGNNAMAWYDKHGNIVIRVHHKDTQTKINF